jgi:hypothetical protein
MVSMKFNFTRGYDYVCSTQVRRYCQCRLNRVEQLHNGIPLPIYPRIYGMAVKIALAVRSNGYTDVVLPGLPL